MTQILIRDYSYEIEGLKDLIFSIQTNVFFTIGTLITVVALGIALGGWALTVLTKQWVGERVNQEIDILNEKVRQYLKDNPQLLFARGGGVLVSSTSRDDGIHKNHEYLITVNLKKKM